ncbi:MAG: hypothetical protein ISS38_03550 [Candidatus Cloacimonetes bacterium]|nr:hypothetical protein [Candidatus Cloacimonadota bacterium]
MKCLSDKKILEYLNDELSSDKNGQISLHIKNCENCQKKMQEWGKVVSLTEQFIETDKENITIPDYNFVTISTETEEKYIWIKHWWKSAAATAAVAAVLLAIIFVAPLQKPDDYSQYVVLETENGSTEAYLFDDNTFSKLEQIMLEEIYQNEELRNEILYSDWENIADMFTEEEIQLLEDEIKKQKNPTKWI